MDELECCVKNIKHRYEMLGYEGPMTATTDRCCQERPFWKRALGLVEDHFNTKSICDDDLCEVEVVRAPFEALVATKSDTAMLFVGWISEYLTKQPKEQRSIIVDREWIIGDKYMDALIICKLEYRV